MAITGVKQEIEQIAKKLNPDSVMLNQDFTSDRVSQEITTKTSNVIHLATHGQFSSKAEETFILTWENKINVKELEQLLRTQELLGEDKIDLLVLSACQTAKGDDQAMLGLAGFAIKSGARSTLGTLWKVRDDSTAIFMNKFYEYLKQPEITKAEAVRKAQLDLIGDAKFNEPLFWAPFILVGNWL
ncbi:MULTISPECIES: CHAT domain-containing protein [unclassified Moorena]|uniref:CHAT domain-containing protein n=1 Tax=unclassified Moorena TaxID=2683338 RepID=UPI0025DBA3B0|nr:MULTISPECIES: CHAT domain-containing protein [unclassified Moorena]